MLRKKAFQLTPSTSSLMGQAGAEGGGSVSKWWEPSAEEGVREEEDLSPRASRHPRTPSTTLCHQFPAWKVLEDPEQRRNRSFFQPHQFPSISTSAWKRPRAGTSPMKALSSCITLKFLWERILTSPAPPNPPVADTVFVFTQNFSETENYSTLPLWVKNAISKAKPFVQKLYGRTS